MKQTLSRVHGQIADASKTVLIAGGLAALVLLALIHRFYFNFRLYYQQNTWEKQRQQERAERWQEYQQFVQQQAEQADSQAGGSDQQQKQGQEQDRSVLLGQQHLYFLFAKRPGLSRAAIQPLTTRLSQTQAGQQVNTQRAVSPSSLHYLDTYLQQQKQRYTNQPLNLTVTIIDKIYSMQDLTRVGDMNNPWGKDKFGVSNLEDQFHQLLDKAGIELQDNERVIFLYFDDQVKRAASERFYDHKKFRSFARESRQTAYVNIYNLSPSFAANVVEIATHEFLHLYGANDKYLEGKFGCVKEGRGHPDQPEAAPQVSTDMMCGLLELPGGEFEKASFVQGEIVINKYTAEEIGWR